ncbi:hypothetical protein [Thermosynechococcus sp.]
MAGLLFSVVGKDYPAPYLIKTAITGFAGLGAIAQDFYGSNRW